MPRASSERPRWDREDIKYAIKKRGSSLADIARQIGLSPTSLAYALEKRHPRANRAISDCIRVPLHELWPAFYPTPLAKATPERAVLSRKNAGASA